MNSLRLVTMRFAYLLKVTVAVGRMFFFLFTDGVNGRLIEVKMACNLHDFLVIFDHIQKFNFFLDFKLLPLALVLFILKLIGSISTTVNLNKLTVVK